MAIRRGARRAGSSARRTARTRVARRSTRSRSSGGSRRASRSGEGYGVEGMYRRAKKTLIGS